MSEAKDFLGSSRRIWQAMSRLTILGLGIAIMSALTQVAAGPGRQFGLWDHNFGFRLLEWGGYGGLAAVGACLIGLFSAWGLGQRRLVVIGVIGALLGALLAYWPWQLNRAFRKPPVLFSITTDTTVPPSYVAALALRKEARLPVEYPANFAAQQLVAYPDIKPVVVKLSTSQAFERALSAARAMPAWTVHIAARDEGRVEAVAKTLWFGFEDDVVIRITASEDGSRIDIRSTGRIGRRDGGANAKRVLAYIERLNGTR